MHSLVEIMEKLEKLGLVYEPEDSVFHHKQYDNIDQFKEFDNGVIEKENHAFFGKANFYISLLIYFIFFFIYLLIYLFILGFYCQMIAYYFTYFMIFDKFSN